MKGLPFVIRVYGVYIDEKRGVLVSDEFIKGKYITKFPGGGLEFGEGLIDCLKREMMEEAGQSFDVLEHFYTTDFFVASAFDPSYQVVSIYYRIKPSSDITFRHSTEPFAFDELKDGVQSFRFIPLSKWDPSMLTLVIDKHVAELILK